MYSTVNITFDCIGGMEAVAVYDLKRAGIRYKEDDQYGVYYQSINARRRLIPPTPRKVYFAKSLRCPHHLSIGLNRFLSVVQLGGNINGFLSHSVLRAQYQDRFFNTFGLHHFHLGSDTQKSGKHKSFIARTGYVAVAMVTSDGVYMLDICQHGRNGDPDLWYDPRFVELIHENWPQLISQWEMKGLLSAVHKMSKSDCVKLARAGLSIPYEMNDGTMYMSPGGSVSCAGTSAEQTFQYSRDIHYFKWAAGQVVHTLCKANNFESLQWPIDIKLVGGFTGKGASLFEDTKNRQYFIVCDENYDLGFSVIRYSKELMLGRIEYDPSLINKITLAIKSEYSSTNTHEHPVSKVLAT